MLCYKLTRNGLKNWHTWASRKVGSSTFSNIHDSQGLFIEELYYVWMHWVIKMAFLSFYLRFATKLFKKLVYCTIGLNTLFTLIQWLIYCLQCIPLDTFVHPTAHPNVKCLDNSVLAFVPAALVSPWATFQSHTTNRTRPFSPMFW